MCGRCVKPTLLVREYDLACFISESFRIALPNRGYWYRVPWPTMRGVYWVPVNLPGWHLPYIPWLRNNMHLLTRAAHSLSAVKAKNKQHHQPSLCLISRRAQRVSDVSSELILRSVVGFEAARPREAATRWEKCIDFRPADGATAVSVGRRCARRETLTNGFAANRITLFFLQSRSTWKSGSCCS